MTMTPHRFTAAAVALSLAAGASTLTLSAQQPKFLGDDPIWVERDTVSVERMKPLEPSLFVDLTYNLIANRKAQPGGRAGNINSVDEVPDSSWFTNRLGT